MQFQYQEKGEPLVPIVQETQLGQYPDIVRGKAARANACPSEFFTLTGIVAPSLFGADYPDFLNKPSRANFTSQASEAPFQFTTLPFIDSGIFPQNQLRRNSLHPSQLTQRFEPLSGIVAPLFDYYSVSPTQRLEVRRLHASQLTQRFEPLSDIIPPIFDYGIYPSSVSRRKGQVASGSFDSPHVTFLTNLGVYPDIVRGKGRTIEGGGFRTDLVITIAVPTQYGGIYPDAFRRKIQAGRTEAFHPLSAIIAPTMGYAEYPNLFPRANKLFRRNFYNQEWGAPANPPVAQGNILLAPVNTTETWGGHFTTRGWNTISDQISAGYPYYAQPAEPTGQYIEVFDFGAIYSNVIVNLDWNTLALTGTVSISSQIETSADGITYSAPTIGVSAFASSLRFARVTINFTGLDNNAAIDPSAPASPLEPRSLIGFFNFHCALNVKREQDGGSIDVLSTDVGGTIVNFTKAFKAVESITVTPLSTLQYSAVFDFSYPPNPTSFKVLVFDSVGARASVKVGWSARGVI